MVAVNNFERSTEGLAAPLFASPILTFPGAEVGEGVVLNENPPAPPPTGVGVNEMIVLEAGELRAVPEADEAGAGELRVIVKGLGTEALEVMGWGAVGAVVKTGGEEMEERGVMTVGAGSAVDAPQPTVTVETTVTVRMPSVPITTIPVGSTPVLCVVVADGATTVVIIGALTEVVGAVTVTVTGAATVLAGGVETVTLGAKTDVVSPVDAGRKVMSVN
jgi:hypothetical protein